MLLDDSGELVTLTAVGNMLLEMSELDTSERSLMSLSFSRITFNNISNTVISFAKNGEENLDDDDEEDKEEEDEED